MSPVEMKDPERVLVVVAHPDDADFGSGGTVAKLIAEGVEVHFCVATNGDLGGFDRSIDRAEIPLIRQKEQNQDALKKRATFAISQQLESSVRTP